MYYKKANLLFIVKIATELLNKGGLYSNLYTQYHKEIIWALNRFKQTQEHYYYKVILSDVDLERFNLKYLFFKNELKKLETKFEVVRIGDLFKEHQLNHDYKKARTFDNLILFKRFLGNDKLYNVIYVNKKQLKFILDLEKRNKVSWYNVKDNQTEYSIVKRGNSIRNPRKSIVFNIETEEDITSITLKQILSVINFKYRMYDKELKYRMYDEEYRFIDKRKIGNKSKMAEIINEIEYERVNWKNDNVSLKFLFAEHMRAILQPLFESNEEEEGGIEEDNFKYSAKELKIFEAPIKKETIDASSYKIEKLLDL